MNTTLPDDIMDRPLSLAILGIIAVAILLALYFTSLENYLLFHSIVELAGIAIAFSIFILIWNTRKVITNTFFLIVGISFLFTGSIDLLHTLAYKGMGVFAGNSADLPTQLWIAARYFQSITFFIATLFIGKSITKDRNYDTAIILTACAGFCGFLLASIFLWHDFPPCFVEGSGLTLFKIFSEYIISLLFIAAFVVLFLKRKSFEAGVWQLLIAALVFLVLGELAFTSYISVYGFMNMLGHLLRLISVYLFYRAFVVVGLTRPYDLLLRDLKKEEEALQENETKFREIFNSANDAIHLHEIRDDGLPGKFIDVNDMACRMVRYSKEEMLEISPLDITTDYHSRPLEEIGEEIKTRGFTLFETEHRRKDGVIVPVEVNFRIVIIAGRRMGLSIIRDLTWRKQDEAALKASERKYRTLFENMLEGFAYCKMIYDDTNAPVDWEYLAVNRAFEQITGLKDITGKRVLEAIPDVRELTPELFNAYGRVASTGNPETFEIDFKPLNLWLNVSVFSPEKSYFVAVFDDITARKRAEDELSSLNNQLEERVEKRTAELKAEIVRRRAAEESIRASLQEKEILLREIHHRVKNNLQIIISLLNLQSRQFADPTVKDALRDSQNRIHAISMVHERLFLSGDLENIDLKTYIRSLANNLPSFYKISTERVRINIVLDNLTTTIDTAVPLGLIINELIANSLRHAFPDERAGEITVFGTDAGGVLEIRVSDNGVGMTPVADPDEAKTLGLKLVHILIEQLDGTVEYTSPPGTTVLLRIPKKEG